MTSIYTLVLRSALYGVENHIHIDSIAPGSLAKLTELTDCHTAGLGDSTIQFDGWLGYGAPWTLIVYLGTNTMAARLSRGYGWARYAAPRLAVGLVTRLLSRPATHFARRPDGTWSPAGHGLRAPRLSRPALGGYGFASTH